MATRDLKPVFASLLFGALICTPMAGHLLGRREETSAIEKRRLAPLPTIERAVAEPAGLPAATNFWLEDHFGFRGVLISLYEKLIDSLDLDDDARVVRGDDGWLFDNLNKSLAMHQGAYPYPPKDAEAFLDAAMAIGAACEQPFAVLIAPNKHTIYPEKLSRYPRRAYGLTRLEELEALAAERRVPLASPRLAMLAEKPTAQLYYATDTHWNAYGAYVGYRALMASLLADGLDTDVLLPDRMVADESDTLQSDLWGLLGVADGPSEPRPRFHIVEPAGVISDAPAPEFANGPYNAFRISTNREDQPSLLLYGDSFAGEMMPFLKESFGEVLFVHHRSLRPPLRALDGCAFDAVAIEFVERLLSLPLRPSADAAAEQVAD